MTRQELRAYWQEQLAAHAASGLSGLAWCEREGVCYSTFVRWRRRLREAVPSASLALIRVTAHAPVGSPLVISVGAARIEVPTDFDPLLRRRVVVALEGVG